MKLENQEFIDRKIADEGFACEEQVVDEAIRRWREQEEVDGLEELRRKIDVGVFDLNAGRSAPLDIEAIKDRLRAEFGSS